MRSYIKSWYIFCLKSSSGMLLLLCKRMLTKPGNYTDKMGWGKQTQLSELTTYAHCAHLECCVNTFKRKSHDPSSTTLSLSRETCAGAYPTCYWGERWKFIANIEEKHNHTHLFSIKNHLFPLECRPFQTLNQQDPDSP